MTVGIGSLVAGRYRVGDLIGRGGMADVHRATDERLDREVALKVLRTHTESTAERDRFAQEARLVAGLSHPGIVALLDAGLEDDQPWLAMQLVDGSTLGAHLAGTPLRDEDVASVGRQVAEGLAHAHASGIVHRDVKPGNILIAPDGRALLADFGIARLLDSTTRHTAVGQAIGSPAYLAPEQVTGAEISGATDVYALGLVLLEALTGERAWRGTTTEIVYARVQGPPVLPEGLSPSWLRLLGRMTAVDPALRPTAAAVAAQLRAAAATGLETTQEVVHQPDSRPVADADRTRLIGQVPGTRRARLFPVLAVIGVVALVILWLVLRSPTQSATPDVPAVPSGAPADLQDELSDLHDAIHGVAR